MLAKSEYSCGEQTRHWQFSTWILWEAGPGLLGSREGPGLTWKGTEEGARRSDAALGPRNGGLERGEEEAASLLFCCFWRCCWSEEEEEDVDEEGEEENDHEEMDSRGVADDARGCGFEGEKCGSGFCGEIRG